jgi:hypothetical protein
MSVAKVTSAPLWVAVELADVPGAVDIDPIDVEPEPPAVVEEEPPVVVEAEPPAVVEVEEPQAARARMAAVERQSEVVRNAVGMTEEPFDNEGNWRVARGRVDRPRLRFY